MCLGTSDQLAGLQNSTPTTKSAQRRIAVAKKNAKKEKDAAKAAMKVRATPLFLRSFYP